MTTDYANTDHPDMQNKYHCALDNAKSGGAAVDWIFWMVFALALNLLGIASYSAILAWMSPIVFGVLVLSTVILYLLGKYQISNNETGSLLRTETVLSESSFRVLLPCSQDFENISGIYFIVIAYGNLDSHLLNTSLLRLL